jgi:calcium-dependent protein kinase
MLTGTNFLGNPSTLKECEARRRVRDRTWVRHRLRHARECRDLSPEAQDFLSLMLRHDRHQRPTAREALRHPFLASTDTVGLYPPEVVRRAKDCLEDFPSSCRAFTSEPVLVRGVLLVMAHFSAYCFDETRPQRLAFAIADANSDGELSIEALESYYLQSTGSVPDGLEEAFRELDLDDDGYISYTEFLSATLPRSVRSNQALLRELFKGIDRNNDGYIDAQDLAEIFLRGGSDTDGACRAALLEVVGPRSPMPRLGWQELLELIQRTPPRQ